MELEAMKAEIAREILNEEDEYFLEEIICYIRDAKKAILYPEIIPGLPRTDEEKLASIKEAEEDLRAGRIHTLEEVRQRHPEPVAVNPLPN